MNTHIHVEQVSECEALVPGDDLVDDSLDLLPVAGSQ